MPAEIVATVPRSPLEFAPGREVPLLQLGLLPARHRLEKVSGKPYATLLEEFILKPLGMNDSGYASPGSVSCPRLATGYRPHGADNAQATRSSIPRGCLPRDASIPRWRICSSGNARCPPTRCSRAANSRRCGRRISGNTVTAGRSCRHHPDAEPSLVFHAGGIPGFATDLLRYPDERVTVIILANLNPVGMAEMSHSLSAIMFGEPLSDAARAARRSGWIPAIYERTWAGTRSIRRYRSTSRVKAIKLIVQATGQQRDIAVPESPDTFYSRISPARLTFVKDASGKVAELIIHDPTATSRPSKMVPVLAAEETQRRSTASPATAATGAMYCTTFTALCPPDNMSPAVSGPSDGTHASHATLAPLPVAAHGCRVVRRRDAVQRVVGAEQEEAGDAAVGDDHRVFGGSAQRHQRNDERRRTRA